MRKNLVDLRGQLVAWKGWETNSRYNNTWACISKATVTPWRFNIPIQKSFTHNLTKIFGLLLIKKIIPNKYLCNMKNYVVSE